MPCKCNPPGAKSKARERAEAVLRQRAQYRSPVDGLTWAEIACDENCQGWDAFDVGGDLRSRSARETPPNELGVAIQACDDCNQIAKSAGLPILRDSDARELPAAKRELQRLRFQVTGNPGSVMTGPAWSSAREKLRGAAAGTRKNPPLRILHLEDDAQIASAVQRALRRYGEVTTVDSVRLAIEALEGEDDYDLVISDYDVKGGTADELVEYLRDNQPLVLDNFFFLSGNDAAKRWGYPTLEKPASAADLRRMVEALASKSAEPTSNPAPPAEALEKYEEFHRYAPTKIGEFARGFTIPAKMLRAGPARWTTYRSAKVDPATLKRPRRPVNYIHEHDAGVGAYVVNDRANRDFLDSDEIENVPAKFRDVAALVKLGDALGFCFGSPVYEEDVEVESTDPLPELYCTPDGKCLLVIQGKAEVLAMIWGGGLGVYARGIDG